MRDEHSQIDETEFVRHFVRHGPQLMWFLGAGSSRSSGLPTAQDLIWDLKRSYYCSKENQDVQAHKLSNHAIKAKIQSYFERKDCPAAWSPEEYSFYFELVFGQDYNAQRSYIQDQLSPDKVTLTIGQRVLVSLLEIGHTRLVFTTNFDDVVEAAYAAVTGKTLSAFHIEGSYAAIDALNAERFPIYTKLHGDFRYRSIKNLSQDLLDNDAELQRCFIAGAGRYGLVVAGYSGRDANVMAMLEATLDQPNAFPQGIWWTAPRAATVIPVVAEFIERARAKDVNAHIVETGPFDVMMSKLWRQLPDKPEALDEKVRSAQAQPVSIPLPEPGRSYPILRTNALEIVDMPRRCAMLPAAGVPATNIFTAVNEKRPDAIVSYQDGVVFWGEPSPVKESLKGIVANDVSEHDIADPAQAIAASTYLKSFYESAIAEAVCRDKPVLLRKKGKASYAIVNTRHADDARFAALKNAVGYKQPGPICGRVPGLQDTYWHEAVRIRLEERSGVLWLLLEPDIWIRPLTQREDAQEFLYKRKIRRYNNQSYQILNAWIEILLGAVGQGAPVTVAYAPDSPFPAEFTVSTRTAFSRRGAA